jgi:hypothetical protein
MKLLAAALLILCVGVHLLEVSGRWDRTLQDANDEAGLVAVVLCIGIAASVARGLLNAIRLVRIATPLAPLSARARVFHAYLAIRLPSSAASPPLALRI